MNNPTDRVRERLLDGSYTCVVRLDAYEYTSYERGVKPLIDLLQTGSSLRGAVAADKCVGAGAAHLYVLLGISAVWAGVISTSAINVLENNGIKVYFEKQVPYIINSKGDGVCPIENAVADAKTSEEAYELILSALRRLQAGTKNDAVKLFKALADDNRLEIMELLMSGEKCGCEHQLSDSAVPQAFADFAR